MRELRRDLPPSCPSPARGEGTSELAKDVILKDLSYSAQANRIILKHSLHNAQANSVTPINTFHPPLDRPFPPCGGRTGRGERTP